MRDIILYDDMRIVFCKKLWNDAELVLAKCYNFRHDVESGEIECLLMSTSKISVFTFIGLAFRNFSESLHEQERRDTFYTRLETMYTFLENQALQLMQEKLPYYPKLYAHQKEGIYFGLTHRANLLAFQMRLGKSITSASLSKLLNVKRTVIICPAIAKWGWFRDLTSETWGFNSLFFTMIDRAKSKSFRALNERFVIINYDIVKKHLEYLKSEEVGHFIIDECHRIKNRNSDRSKVMQDLVDHFPNAKITLLSGTPIPNRFDDLFNYFKLTKHALGESFKIFTDEYTVKTTVRGGEKVTGARNIQDLKNKMSNFMLIKRMDECFDMPEDVISRYTFQLDDYREEYENVIKEMAAQKNGAAQKGNLHTLNIITCKSKMAGMIEAIEEIIAENGKIVIFGSYKEPLAILEDYFKERCVKVDGSTPSFDRDRLKQEFWNKPEVEAFIGNYLAAGEALDLSVCSDVFCVNFPFTPREIYQALFRCKHPEKKSHLRVHFTFCEESVDEDLYDLIIDKEKDINALMTDGKEVVARENIHEILIKRILERSKKNGIIDDYDSAIEDVDFEEIPQGDLKKGEVGQFTQKAPYTNSSELQGSLLGTNDVELCESNKKESEFAAEIGSGLLFPDIQIPGLTVSESFNDMAALVRHVEDNKDQFIRPMTGKPGISEDEINANFDHVRKMRESIPNTGEILNELTKKITPEFIKAEASITSKFSDFEPPTFD